MTWAEFDQAVLTIEIARDLSPAPTALAALLWVVKKTINDNPNPPLEVVALKALAEDVAFRILDANLDPDQKVIPQSPGTRH